MLFAFAMHALCQKSHPDTDFVSAVDLDGPPLPLTALNNREEHKCVLGIPNAEAFSSFGFLVNQQRRFEF